MHGDSSNPWLKQLGHAACLLAGFQGIAMLFSCSPVDHAPTLEEQIHAFAWEGDLAEVKALLDRDPALIHATGPHKYSLLYSARSFEMIELFVNAGLDINSMPESGYLQGAPLHVHAMLGHCNTVEALIQAGANVNLPRTFSFGYPVRTILEDYPEETTISVAEHAATPLHLASGGDYTECIEALLDAGADIEAKASDGCTPLLYAARTGSINATNILLESGANLEARTKNGWSALHLCAYSTPFGIDDKMLEFWRDKIEVAKRLIEETGEQALHITDNFGRTPLDIADRTGFDLFLEIFGAAH